MRLIPRLKQQLKSIANVNKTWRNYLIYIDTSSLAYVDQASVNLQNYQIGFLISQNLTTFQISNSIIQNGISNSQGGCFSLLSTQLTANQIKETNLVLQGSKFQSCQSTFFGGAFYGGNITKIQDVSFTNCSSNIGGALFINKASDEVELKKITFNKNVANLQGQDISLGIEDIQIDKLYQFNPGFLDTPLYLVRLPNAVDSINTVNIYNGINLAIFFKLKIGGLWYNSFNQSFFGNINMYTENPDQFDSQQIQQVNNPYIIYYQNEIHDEFDFIDQFVSSYLVIQKTFSFTVFKQYEEICNVGMELIEVQNSNSYICKYCDYSRALYFKYPNKKDNNKTYPKCNTCDTQYFRTCYSNYTELRETFWRSTYSTDQKDIQTCIIQPKNCIGGSGIQNQLCYEGHVGPQCLNCDTYGAYWNETYATYGQYQCNKCTSISQNFIKIIFLFILFILSICIIISSNFKSLKNFIYALYLSKMGITYIGRSLQKKSLTSVYIKILVFNVFIYSLSNTFTQVDVIQSVKEFSFTLNNPLNSQIFSFSCFLIQILPQNFSLGFANLIAYTLIPIVLMLIITIILGVQYLTKKINLRFFGYSLFLSFLYLFIIVFYSSLFDLCLKSFTCITLQTNKRYSLIDLNIECEQDSSELNQILKMSIPLFIILLVILPLISIGYLFFYRKKLDKIRIMFTFGFLYKEYKKDYFYWEYVRFFLKIVFISLSLSFKQYSQIVGVTISIILVTYLITLQKLQPFNLKFLNTLEIFSITISIFILQSSIMFQEINSQVSSVLFSKIIYVFFQMINVAYVLYLVSLIIISFFENQIKKMQNYFRCLQCLHRYFPDNQQRIHSNMKKFRECVKKLEQHQLSINEELQETSNQILIKSRLSSTE